MSASKLRESICQFFPFLNFNSSLSSTVELIKKFFIIFALDFNLLCQLVSLVILFLPLIRIHLSFKRSKAAARQKKTLAISIIVIPYKVWRRTILLFYNGEFTEVEGFLSGSIFCIETDTWQCASFQVPSDCFPVRTDRHLLCQRVHISSFKINSSGICAVMISPF